MTQCGISITMTSPRHAKTGDDHRRFGIPPPRTPNPVPCRLTVMVGTAKWAAPLVDRPPQHSMPNHCQWLTFQHLRSLSWRTITPSAQQSRYPPSWGPLQACRLCSPENCILTPNTSDTSSCVLFGTSAAMALGAQLAGPRYYGDPSAATALRGRLPRVPRCPSLFAVGELCGLLYRTPPPPVPNISLPDAVNCISPRFPTGFH